MTSIGTDSFSNIEIFIGTDFADTFTGNATSRRYIGGAGDDVFAPGGGNDTVEGGAGSDTVSYLTSQTDTVVDLNLTTAQISAGDAGGDTLLSIENVIGSVNVNTLTGNAADNRLVGGLSADTLTGNDGDDTLIGGEANDVLDGGLGADAFDGGGGFDSVTYRESLSGITVDLDAGTGLGGEAEGDTFVDVEYLYGSDFADTITGNDAANRLFGFDGDDVIEGGGGRRLSRWRRWYRYDQLCQLQPEASKCVSKAISPCATMLLVTFSSTSRTSSVPITMIS